MGPPFLKGVSQAMGDEWIQRKQEDAGHRSIEAVHRIHPLPDLVSEKGHAIFVGMHVNLASVNQEACRLMDRDQILVAVEDFQNQ